MFEQMSVLLWWMQYLKLKLLSKLRFWICVLFNRITANVECMQRAGLRGHFTIHRYCPCQRAMNLPIGMNPAWCIHCVELNPCGIALNKYLCRSVLSFRFIRFSFTIILIFACHYLLLFVFKFYLCYLSVIQCIAF